jgi:hypothetical protein
MAPKNRQAPPKPARASLARSPWRIALLAAILAGAVVALIVVPGRRSSPSVAAVPGSPPSSRAPAIALTSLNGHRLRLPAPGRPGMVVVFYDRAGNIRGAVIEPSLVDIENAFRKTGTS